MNRIRATLAFLGRYLTLAGKNCCAGRSQAGLERSIDRRTRTAE